MTSTTYFIIMWNVSPTYCIRKESAESKIRSWKIPGLKQFSNHRHSHNWSTLSLSHHERAQTKLYRHHSPTCILKNPLLSSTTASTPTLMKTLYSSLLLRQSMALILTPSIKQCTIFGVGSMESSILIRKAVNKQTTGKETSGGSNSVSVGQRKSVISCIL